MNKTHIFKKKKKEVQVLAVESQAGVHAITDSQAIVVGSKYFFWKDRQQYLRWAGPTGV